ncbi:MAG: translocation/assembly module TamB domain-containing protein, partial [Planctomycetota bacterium]
ILRRTPEQPVVVRGEVDDIAVETVFRDVPVKIRGGPMTLLEEEIQVEDLWLETGDAQVHVLTASLPRGESRHGSVSIDATNLHPVEHLTPLLTEGFQQVMGDNMRVDLKDFTVEFNRHDGTIICSGAADLRRAEMRDARAAVLEPTGALGFAPLTLRLPQGPDDPFRFSRVIDFRGLNMNLQLDASDMSGQLMVADGVLSKYFAFKGAIFGGKVTVMKRVIEEINCNIEFEPNYLSMENIDARFYVGDFKGGIHVHLADPGAFKLNLKATGVDLAEMLEEELPREGGFGGTVDASIEIESRSGELRDMTGHGEIKVREGQLFKLPILRTILSIVSRVAPLGGDAPRFKHAQVIFDIEGETFQVRKFHLGTNSNDVYGYGTVTLYGDMNLVVEPQVTKYIDLPRLINIPVLSTLRNLLHRTVYQIRMEGTIDSPALRLRGLPFLRREHKPFTQSTHAGRVQRIRPSILP